MRIAHITPFYHPVVGGVEEVVKRISEHMTSRGFEVYVLTYNRLRIGGLGSLPREEYVNGVHVIRLKPNFVWSHVTYSNELPAALERLRPDVTHVHVWRHPHVFQVAEIKKKLGFKAILHSHAPFHRFSQLGIATWLYHKTVDLLFKKSLKVYDVIIALTPYEKRILMRCLGVNEENVCVIPNGVSEEFFISGGDIRNSEKIVLYVGRISRSKNVDLLVKAMAHVRRYIPARLFLVGPDEGLIGKLKSLSLKNGVDMRYFGQISRDNLKELYRKCTLFGHPAVYEPFGITLLEAQASGKPCVITGFGGQLYVAPPDVTSLYAKADPKDFGDKILTLLMDEGLYSQLSSNARKWVVRFLWSKILLRYEQLYDQLCG